MWADDFAQDDIIAIPAKSSVMKLMAGIVIL